jgi:large subunit ribosomal protein L17
MRHKHKRVLELNTWIVKTTTVLRNMLTNLVDNGKMETTIKRSKSLKAFTDHFFARLVRINKTKDAADAKREAIRYVTSVVYTETAGKKIVNELLPRYLDEWVSTWFVTNYKMWFRSGDAAEKVLVKLV